MKKEPSENPSSNYPYALLLPQLLVSVKRAQLSVLSSTGAATEKLDAMINGEFQWLVKATKIGTDRHLIDGDDSADVSSLRRMKDENPQTRISLLVRTSVISVEAQIDNNTNSPSRTIVIVASPLRVCFDYLCVPGHPGTSAYALVACRNYLFAALKIHPKMGLDETNADEFTVENIRREFSNIWTSLRPRQDSKGRDKLPAGSKTKALLRHFLAMKGVLNFRCSIEDAKRYLLSDDEASYALLGGDLFEFDRAHNLDHLPEIGELVNELWGLPIALDGADTILRGGIKFSSTEGLILAIHGGPGSGKTSLALAIAKTAGPLDIRTLFYTVEEVPADLIAKSALLVAEGIGRLSIFKDTNQAVAFEKLPTEGDVLSKLISELTDLEKLLESEEAPALEGIFSIPKPCRVIVVLDGLHDMIARSVSLLRSQGTNTSNSEQANDLMALHNLISHLRKLRAFVIVTTGTAWTGEGTLDYLVDMAMHVSVASLNDSGVKPERLLVLSKARHQLCAIGTHSFQIDGNNGVRISPQMNYQIERRAIWRASLPDRSSFKKVLSRARIDPFDNDDTRIDSAHHSIKLFKNSHVVINGIGSGGKAGLALKIAMSPYFEDQKSKSDGKLFRSVIFPEKILVISFLYQKDYYDVLVRKLRNLLSSEYSESDSKQLESTCEVLHLYPGNLRPHDLFNRIDRKLDGAELMGRPYSTVIIDGIHNVYLQFPQIQQYPLFWAQLFSSLRTRKMSVITTHTTLALPYALDRHNNSVIVDDNRSEPLRHSLVQKSDFQIEVDPVPNSSMINVYAEHPQFEKIQQLHVLKVVAAIGQPVPFGVLLWNRDKLTLSQYHRKQYAQSNANDSDRNHNFNTVQKSFRLIGEFIEGTKQRVSARSEGEHAQKGFEF